MLLRPLSNSRRQRECSILFEDGSPLLLTAFAWTMRTATGRECTLLLIKPTVVTLVVGVSARNFTLPSFAAVRSTLLSVREGEPKMTSALFASD